MIDNLVRPSLYTMPSFFKYLSNNKLPQLSGIESANTPKKPLKTLFFGINTPFFNGNEKGDIEKPFISQLESYSKANLSSYLAK